jgi:hypothetical protein
LPFSFDVSVPIVYPDSETTVAKGWDGRQNGKWMQTIHSSADPQMNWETTEVKERNPGTGKITNDTCWCKGSSVLPYWTISGGKWPNSVDTYKWPNWGPDHVGWYGYAIDYYRGKRRAPCGTTFPQQMQFSAEAVFGPWKDYGAVNTLGGSFNYQQITSRRAGHTTTKTYHPVATKTRLACKAIWPKSATSEVPTLGADVVVADARPVADALDQIENVTGVPIGYEDVRVLAPQDLVPMVENDGGDAALRVPKGGSLAFGLPKSVDAQAVAAAVRAVVATYNASQGRTVFTVERVGSTLSVAPRQSAANSRRVVGARLLDRPIKLAPRNRSGLDVVEEICRQLTASTGEKVNVGTIAVNALAGQRADFGVVNEPARAVLAKLLQANGRPMSWRLFYDPGTHEYVLNIPIVQPVAQPSP